MRYFIKHYIKVSKDGNYCLQACNELDSNNGVCMYFGDYLEKEETQ